MSFAQDREALKAEFLRLMGENGSVTGRPPVRTLSGMASASDKVSGTAIQAGDISSPIHLWSLGLAWITRRGPPVCDHCGAKVVTGTFA